MNDFVFPYVTNFHIKGSIRSKTLSGTNVCVFLCFEQLLSRWILDIIFIVCFNSYNCLHELNFLLNKQRFHLKFRYIRDYERFPQLLLQFCLFLNFWFSIHNNKVLNLEFEAGSWTLPTELSKANLKENLPRLILWKNGSKLQDHHLPELTKLSLAMRKILLNTLWDKTLKFSTELET